MDMFNIMEENKLYLWEDGVRLQRALDRENNQKVPQYMELCRRFLADSTDFSEENIGKRSITKVIDNNGDIQETIEEVNKVLNLYL